MSTKNPIAADVITALCEALGYDPSDVTRLDVRPGAVQVEYLLREFVPNDWYCDMPTSTRVVLV